MTATRAVTLGHIDPAYFLGGAMKLDAELARAAVERPDPGGPVNSHA